MDQYQLDFDEESVIASILKARPELEETTFRKYFRRIVTILSIEKGL